MHPAIFLIIAGVGLLIVTRAIDVTSRKQDFDDETMPCPHCGEQMPKLCIECLACRKPID